MWISFVPESRIIINFIIGPRKRYVADEFIKVTDKHFSDSKSLIVTDGLKFYAEALLKNIENGWSFLKLAREEDLRNQQ